MLKRLLNTGCRRSSVLILALLLMLAGGCDTREAQEDFLDDAFKRPEGITRTGNDGEVVNGSVDEDDWRTAPAYTALVDVAPAYPNPSNGRLVTINVSVLHAGAVQGQLVLRHRDEVTGEPEFLDSIPQSSQPGFYSFTFPSSVLGDEGIERVYIYDEYSSVGGALVSYGDIQL